MYRLYKIFNFYNFSTDVYLFMIIDEEVGGRMGLGEFVKTEDFKKLKVGFALDEGLACSEDYLVVYNGERSIWRKFLKNYFKMLPVTLYKYNI